MTQHTRPVLVLGATGGQGGDVVDALLDRAVPVRALVRNPESDAARHLGERGVEVVAGRLDDTASLTSAMDEVSSVFAVTTPFESGPEAEVRQGRAILAAVRSAQVPHLVFSSVAGAHQHSGVPHFDSKAEIERDLVESGVPCTILGPTYFFDNALGGEREIRDGVLELPLPPDRALQQIARANLGRIGAEILIAPEKFVGRRIELAGDQPTPPGDGCRARGGPGSPGASHGGVARHDRGPRHARHVDVSARRRLSRRPASPARGVSPRGLDVLCRVGH